MIGADRMSTSQKSGNAYSAVKAAATMNTGRLPTRSDSAEKPREPSSPPTEKTMPPMSIVVAGILRWTWRR